jgi:hypothetical protein
LLEEGISKRYIETVQYDVYGEVKLLSRLILQSVTLSWSKELRGSPYSTLRTQYNKSFALPETIFNYNLSYGIPYHNLFIVQQKKGFKIESNKQLILNANENKYNIGCIEISKNADNFIFTYKYSAYCGKPARYDKYNNFLIEKAFDLSLKEYGRIIYNGRLTDRDTGEWYYETHILNAYYTNEFNPKIFLNRRPKKEYKQLAILK